MIDVKSYKDNGYLLEKQFFHREEIARIRDEARQIFIAQMLRLGIVQQDEVTEAVFERGMYDLFDADLQSFTNCGKQAQHLISLHRLSLDERVVRGIVDLGLECPSVSTRPVLYFNSRRLAKKEVYWRLSLHQDWRSMQGSLDSVVVWVPLMNIDRSLGALEIIPGSHKRGLLQADMIDGYGRVEEAVTASDLVPVEVEAGDALFFSAFLLHQSGTSVGDAIRWSCHFRYNNLHEPTFIERGFPHPYIYKPQEELITKDFPPPARVADVFRG
jgi:phytanoyl-CoA hydroxylase